LTSSPLDSGVEHVDTKKLGRSKSLFEIVVMDDKENGEDG
jgi:hypothetical protein